MSLEAAYRLQARLPAQYLNGNHVTYWVSDMVDMATVAVWAASSATQAAASAASASATYALHAALGISAYGVGWDAMKLPRMAQLGSMAFLEWNIALGTIAKKSLATGYQVRPDDFSKLLIAETGANSWPLPAAADLPEGWFCRWRCRTGATLTFTRSGTDTINAAATSVAVTAGAGGLVVRNDAGTFEVY